MLFSDFPNGLFLPRFAKIKYAKRRSNLSIHYVGKLSFFYLIFPVTERSEDTGLVYPLSVVRRAERSKFTMKDYFSFEEQGAIAEKLILAISGQKKKSSRQIKKCVKKVRKQD